MVGSTIGKYRIVEQLGRGGMGTVYKAIDETLDREVAIKTLNADLLSSESLQRFRGEAVTLAKLNHPRIAAIHELTRADHDLLMVMEYVKGETCEKLLARTGPLPVSRAVVLCDQILDALEHAHAAGIVHRDLKPGNVMLTASGDVKVMDFGIARVAGSEHLTLDGFMMGTPAYMAPEQVRGEEVDRRMDLYSAAVMFYRFVTHRLPFEADSPVTLIHSQLSDPPTPPRQFRPDLPEWIDAILTRGLAKAPADRFQTAAEFRLALERGLAGSLGQTLRPAFPDDNAETIGPMPTPTALRTVHSVAATPKVTPTANVTPTSGSTHLDTSVTLRTPHLAVAGALLGLLVVAVGFLAYAALRRPIPSIVQPGPTAEQTMSTSPTSSTLSTSSTGAPGSESSMPSTASTSSPSSPGNAGTNDQRLTTNDHAAAQPTPTPAPPAPAAQATAPAPITTTAPVKALPTAPPAQTAPSASIAKGPPPAAVRGAVPGSANAGASVNAPESFGDLKVLVADGTKAKELDALLGFEADRLVVRNRDNGVVRQTKAYGSIAAATYTRAKGPRWSDAASVAPIPKNFSGSGFFLKSSRHWLTLQSKTDFLIVRLEDKNVRAVLAAVESRTGTKVRRASGDKDDK